MERPTLLVLAAGMGSRYGSLKQMDGLGPNGEAIIDYSIYDAIRAGFGKVVFVIRHSFEKEFRALFSASRFGGKIAVDYVFQELDYLPAGSTVPEGRLKPWGTNHAVMMAAKAVKEPFAVINADDFYGKDAYKVLSDCLQNVSDAHNKYCMVGYYIENTLSDFGTVSRGVCEVDARHNLVSMVERTAIEKVNGAIVYKDAENTGHVLAPKTPVSMNMFGFTPDYFAHSETYFKTFLQENAANVKAEFFIPLMVNKLVSEQTAQMRVLETDATWFGVTYKEDRPTVVAKIQALIAQHDYPQKLWE